jgi:L-ascorbate metabolism protein UlaG (beta-lactamase superfamily)
MTMLRKTVLYLLLFAGGLSLITFLFMQQKPFGKNPSRQERMARITKSPQYRDGIFHNREATKMLADDASYWGMATKFFGKGVDREPLKDLPVIDTDLHHLPADKPVLVWFGHSSYLLSVGGKRILSDPVFSKRASPVQYSGPKAYPGTEIYSVDDFPDLDVVVITHDHYDHLDYNSILKLNEKTKMFCVPLGIGEHLESWGIPENKITEFDWWETRQIADSLELTCTPARHFSGRGFTRNKTLWGSFVIQLAGQKVFFGGDSGFDGAFKEIGDKYGPFDIAMLECGQYDLQWPQIHMMPEETVQAAIDLKAKVFLPVHWGKFTLALHEWRDPIRRAVKRAEETGARVTTPQIGDPIILGEYLPANRWWEEVNP